MQASGPSALVFEPDLDLDAVLDDLTVLDDCASTSRPPRSAMLRTVFDAVVTAWRAASLHDLGLVPTISRMMMTPTAASSILMDGHHDTRPTRFRAGLVAAQEIRRRRSGALDGHRLVCQGPGPDLVETGAAVDGSIVPGRERYDGLTPAGPADRGMELSWALVRSSALRDRPARGTALWVVGQPLAGKEGLLAGGEAELLRTIATGQATVLVHPLQTLLGSDATTQRSATPSGQRVGGERAWEGCAPGRPGLGARYS